MLTRLVSILGVTGVSLLVSLEVGAKEALNPNPTIFQETSYNRALKNQIQANKSESRSSNLIAQASGSLNPSPSILDECPYNRAACDTTTTPVTPEIETPPSEPVTPPEQPPETTPPTGTEESSDKNLLEVAESNGSFTTLVSALKAAGLAETLQGEGPFTVFAPTDEAFAKLPQDAVQDLLKPENKEVLVKILRYHVVPNEVLSKDLQPGEVKSVDGAAINVKVDPTTGVMVNDAKVSQPDLKASNGVIHVIDNVILPPDL